MYIDEFHVVRQCLDGHFALDPVILYVSIALIALLAKGLLFRFEGTPAHYLYNLEVALVAVIISASGVGWFDMRTYAVDSYAAESDLFRSLALTMSACLWLVLLCLAMYDRRRSRAQQEAPSAPLWARLSVVFATGVITVVSLAVVVLFWYGGRVTA